MFLWKQNVLVFAVLAVVCASCTRAQPSIDYWTARLVWQQVDGNTIPTMNFFVIASDPDGAEDLDELRLYHDGEGLVWNFNSENWIRLEEAGRVWLGSKMLRMPLGESFPSGQYRVVIVDKGGEQGSKTFGFEVPADSRYRFPRLTVVDGNYTVVSDYPENYIMCYHVDGAFRNQIKLTNKSGTLGSLRLAADVFSIALWAEDVENTMSALTPSVSIRHAP